MIYIIGNGITPTSSAAFTAVASGTGLKTLLQVKPGTTQFLKIIAWGISFDGTSANTPGKVELVETDVAATSLTASVAGDITKVDSEALSAGDPTTAIFAVGTSSTGYTAGAEGSITTTRYLDGPMMLAPTGSYYFQIPLGQEAVIQPSKFARIRVLFGTTVNVICWMKLAA